MDMFWLIGGQYTEFTITFQPYNRHWMYTTPTRNCKYIGSLRQNEIGNCKDEGKKIWTTRRNEWTTRRSFWKYNNSNIWMLGKYVEILA